MTELVLTYTAGGLMWMAWRWPHISEDLKATRARYGDGNVAPAFWFGFWLGAATWPIWIILRAIAVTAGWAARRGRPP